jgi:hypothetical protein
MERMTIDLRTPYAPALDPLEFRLDPASQAIADEHKTRRKYAEMMADAQFGPGAILEAEA